MDTSLFDKNKRTKSVNPETGTEYKVYGTVRGLYEKLLSENIDSTIKIPYEIKRDERLVVFNYYGIEIILKYSYSLENLIIKVPEICEYMDCFTVVKYMQTSGQKGIRLCEQPGGLTIKELDDQNKNNRMAQLHNLLGISTW